MAGDRQASGESQTYQDPSYSFGVQDEVSPLPFQKKIRYLHPITSTYFPYNHPHLTSHHLTSPHLTSPHLTSPHLTSPHLTSPHLTSPHLTSPHLTSPHLTSHTFIHHASPSTLLFLCVGGRRSVTETTSYTSRVELRTPSKPPSPMPPPNPSSRNACPTPTQTQTQTQTASLQFQHHSQHQSQATTREAPATLLLMVIHSIPLFCIF